MRLLSILFVLSHSIVFGQQTGKITGKITCERNAVPFVNVGLSNTSYGTSTNEQGVFNINNIPIGKYTLQASAIGYKNYKRTIEVKPNETVSIQFELEKMEQQLNEVVITGTLK
jgi:hypothetical protein